MNKESKIGSQIEAFCSKCKRDSIHFITATEGKTISKVMCDVCGSYHKYRNPQSAAHAKTAKAAASPKSRKAASETTGVKKVRKTTRSSPTVDWGAAIGKMDTSKAVIYNLKESYVDIPLIDHKDFGLGIIKKIHSGTKIEVVFEKGIKMLVQNWRE